MNSHPWILALALALTLALGCNSTPATTPDGGTRTCPSPAGAWNVVWTAATANGPSCMTPPTSVTIGASGFPTTGVSDCSGTACTTSNCMVVPIAAGSCNGSLNYNGACNGGAASDTFVTTFNYDPNGVNVAVTVSFTTAAGACVYSGVGTRP